ncbi:MAG: hypothetical protein ACTHKJ_08510 [Candidatus Nitrosocosmicus sp.]
MAKNNNEDRKDATFSFSLPSTDDSIDKKIMMKNDSLTRYA